MIIFKTLTIEELKKDYSTTHGFVFEAPAPSKDSSVELLCRVLIAKDITKNIHNLWLSWRTTLQYMYTIKTLIVLTSWLRLTL